MRHASIMECSACGQQFYSDYFFEHPSTIDERVVASLDCPTCHPLSPNKGEAVIRPLPPSKKHDPPKDAINPNHYRSHPSGVECIQITSHMNFCLGNAVKYIWRAGLKGEALEDLEKAKWYIEREIKRIKETDS